MDRSSTEEEGNVPDADTVWVMKSIALGTSKVNDRSRKRWGRVNSLQERHTRAHEDRLLIHCPCRLLKMSSMISKGMWGISEAAMAPSSVTTVRQW